LLRRVSIRPRNEALGRKDRADSPGWLKLAAPFFSGMSRAGADAPHDRTGPEIMRQTVIGLALTLGLFSSPAFAQPSEDKAFNGMRVEARLGYERTVPEFSLDGFVVADQGWNNLVYGGSIGADRDFGKLVVGFEVGIDSSTGTGDGVIIVYPIEISGGRDILLAARLGYKVTPTWLIYGKGGYSFARFNIISPPDPTAIDSTDLGSYLIAGGVEHIIKGNFYAKLEYRYSSYSPNGRVLGFNVEGDAARHQLLTGVGIRF